MSNAVSWFKQCTSSLTDILYSSGWKHKVRYGHETNMRQLVPTFRFVTRCLPYPMSRTTIIMSLQTLSPPRSQLYTPHFSSQYTTLASVCSNLTQTSQPNRNSTWRRISHFATRTQPLGNHASCSQITPRGALPICLDHCASAE